jgi:hypothetical protein
LSGNPPPTSVSEDSYLVRLNGREIGPIGKSALLELFADGRVTRETEVALASASPTLVFRPLRDEIPIIGRSQRKVCD